MCPDNSATSLCGNDTADYYQVGPRLSHTDLSLCGATNICIVKLLYKEAITPSTSQTEYGMGSPFLDLVLGECNLKPTPSWQFGTTFPPLIQQRVTYYISILDECGAFLVDSATPNGATMVWRALKGWPDERPIAAWMQARRILHDDRIERLGFRFSDVCNDIPAASTAVSDFMNVDLTTYSGDRLDALLSQANLEFHRIANSAKCIQARMEELLRANKSVAHGQVAMSTEELDTMSDATVLSIDLSTLSRSGLNAMLIKTGHLYVNRTTQVGTVKTRVDQIQDAKRRDSGA
ncbi:hypothetical protein PG988_004928 [Apiospora saccharicola]